MTYGEYTERRDQLIALSWEEMDSDEYHRQMNMLVSEYYGDD